MAEDKTYENEVRINSYPRDNKKVNDALMNHCDTHNDMINDAVNDKTNEYKEDSR